MLFRIAYFALLSLALVKPGISEASDSCTDSSGYNFSLISTKLEGSYYVYRYQMRSGITQFALSHWNVFMPDSCGATSSGTCALGGSFETNETTCTNPSDASANKCKTGSWLFWKSDDIMTFKIHKSKVADPTGGTVTVQSKSGNQSGSTCPTCQLKGPICSSVNDENANDKSLGNKSEKTRLIRELEASGNNKSQQNKDEKQKENNGNENAGTEKRTVTLTHPSPNATDTPGENPGVSMICLIAMLSQMCF